jgi:hypothetical protein
MLIIQINELHYDHLTHTDNAILSYSSLLLPFLIFPPTCPVCSHTCLFIPFTSMYFPPLNFTCERKCDICSYETGLFLLTWWSLVPFSCKWHDFRFFNGWKKTPFCVWVYKHFRKTCIIYIYDIIFVNLSNVEDLG